MELIVKLRDPEHRLQVAIAVEPGHGTDTAGDLILGVVGAQGAASLPPGVTVPEESWPALASLRERIFDHDVQGPFIKPGLSFTVDGHGLDPDARLRDLATPVENSGERYDRLEIVIGELELAGGDGDPAIAAYARIALLHMLGIGRHLDVTRDHDAIAGPLAEVEAEDLVTIDVARATWVLTPAGSAAWRKQIDEAQDHLRRYDVFADVAVDPISGIIRFDTGHGEDLRVAVIEREGRDPFRARFLVGLNDGEWDELPAWPERLTDPAWYDEIFDVVARAPGVEDLGAEQLERVRAAGKAFVRDDDDSRRRP